MSQGGCNAALTLSHAVIMTTKVFGSGAARQSMHKSEANPLSDFTLRQGLPSKEQFARDRERVGNEDDGL